MHGALSRRLNLTDPLSTSVILNILSTLVSQRWVVMQYNLIHLEKGLVTNIIARCIPFV